MEPRQQRKLAGILGLLWMTVALGAATRPLETQGGISAHYGFGEHYTRYNLDYEMPALGTSIFRGNNSRLEWVPELGVSYWQARAGRSPSRVWQLSAIPMLRWWPTERWYLEAGVGVSVFSQTRFADKNISTAFQFADTIGLGYLLTPRYRIGLRYAHFSNAGIKTPNPGLNVIEFAGTYQF